MLKLDDQGRDKRQDSDLDARGGETVARDLATTRRALLTGGAVVAGAAVATLASTELAAAVDVVLGGDNSESTPTIFRSSGSRAVTGICYAANAVGITASSSGAHGSGVLGIANTSEDSYGVWGIGDAGAGVRGQSIDNYGVFGTGGAVGVKGESASNYGVHGTGGRVGVYGAGPYGVYGSGASAGGVGASTSGYGLYGLGAIGVVGFGNGTGYGAWGYNPDKGAYGVVGQGGYRGVYGSGGNTGVFGVSDNVGVWGQGPTFGLYGRATATSGENYGVFGSTGSSSAGYAGYFSGRVRVVGTLSKTAGSFKIDHPLDPEHKWLSPSFVESPDMMNVYNGNVTTNSSGVAVVKLPAYFTALNRDFRYQLTVIGKMAHAVVDREISRNQFRIRTDQGNVKVSWQVTGIRQDSYAKEHPIVVEEAKKASEAGARQFVPKGSSARLMRVGPAGADAPMEAPARLAPATLP